MNDLFSAAEKDLHLSICYRYSKKEIQERYFDEVVKYNYKDILEIKASIPLAILGFFIRFS